VLALAPQVEPASFINKLFQFFSLPAALSSVLCRTAYSLESFQLTETCRYDCAYQSEELINF